MTLLRSESGVGRPARQMVCPARSAFCLLLVCGLPVFLMLTSIGQAQNQANLNPSYQRSSTFTIPFDPISPNDRSLQQVELYVSEDQQRWERAGRTTPDQPRFTYRADRDGRYYFAVRTIYANGRAVPATTQGLQADLLIIVDTQPPSVVLRAAPPRDGSIGVEWDIQEEYPDLTAFNLEYRLAGAADWIPLPVEPALTGQKYWVAGTNGQVEVRLRTRDKAKNEGIGRGTLTGAGGEYRQNYTNAEPDRQRAGGQGAARPRFVNSRHISLNYNIEDEGPSKTSKVEVWTTRDLKSWESYYEDKPPKSPLMFDVNEDGLYGFKLVAYSGVGLSERTPRLGDTPDVWVEVDTKKPEVEYVDVRVGDGIELGRVFVSWKATDKNFGPEPISLSYATDLQGPWTKFGTSVANSGRYIWRLQKEGGNPYQFYVRVEATDLAGNVGSKDTSDLVKVDLARPKAKIIEVDAASGKPEVSNKKAPPR